MKSTDPAKCPLDVRNEFYTSPHLRRFFVPLTVFNCIINSFSPVTSVGGSALLLAAVIKFPHLREAPSNVLLASQAVSDLSSGVLVQPFLTVKQVSLLVGNCMFITPGNNLNRFASYWIHALLFSTCLNVCLITVDRYICIAYSLRYQTIVTEKRVLQAVSISWLFSLALAGPSYLSKITIFKATARILSVLTPSFLVVITFLCYSKMAMIARRHKRNIKAQMNSFQIPCEQDFQSTNTSLLMVGVIFLCYVPAIIMALSLYASKDVAYFEALIPFVSTLAFLNSSINPLVYYARSRKIRRYVCKVLNCKQK